MKRQNADITNSFVILTPFYDEPKRLYLNNYLSEEYLIQVDVETYHHQKTIDITKRIRRLMGK